MRSYPAWIMGSICDNSGMAVQAERLKKSFGLVVSRRRVAARMEQREFSRVVGLSNSHLRKIEAGEVSPSLTTILKIASALDTDAGDLVGEACDLAKGAIR